MFPSLLKCTVVATMTTRKSTPMNANVSALPGVIALVTVFV